MDAVRFLQDLTVVLAVAAAALLLFRRLGQPPVLGYLAAGLIIGPHTPPMPLVTDMHSLETMAEVGVIFLLFALGIEFNLARLAKAGLRVALCALIEAALMIAAGFMAGLWLGWSRAESLLLGGVIAVAGTAIVARTLLERAKRPSGWEELVAGMLIAEDMVAVLLIALFSSAASAGSLAPGALMETAGRFGMLVTVLLVVGLLLLPKLLAAAERSGMDEVRTMVVVGTCFGVALLTRNLGYSAALGAFLAGAMASTSRGADTLHHIAAPFRDVFGAVFFVSVGMMIDPLWLIHNWRTAALLAAGVVLVRWAVNFTALGLVGERPAAAAQAALAMLPIGEFSFILAQLAQREGLARQPVYPLAVALCFATTLASAQLLPRASDAALARLTPGWLDALFARYRAALGRAALPPRLKQAWLLMRPSLMQIALNAAGIGALFLGASGALERFPGAEPFPGAAWTAAMAVSLPFLIAMLRKGQAVALLAVEACLQNDARGLSASETHPVLARLAPAAATLLLAWWYMTAGAAILPPWPYSLAPLVALAVAAFALWRRMTRLYASLQTAFRASLTHDERKQDSGAALIVDALSSGSTQLFVMRVREGHWAAGRSVPGTGLRTRTGAMAVSIKRAGVSLQPTPENALKPGDEVLLVGEPEQLLGAGRLFSAGPLDG